MILCVKIEYVPLRLRELIGDLADAHCLEQSQAPQQAFLAFDILVQFAQQLTWKHLILSRLISCYQAAFLFHMKQWPAMISPLSTIRTGGQGVALDSRHSGVARAISGRIHGFPNGSIAYPIYDDVSACSLIRSD